MILIEWYTCFWLLNRLCDQNRVSDEGFTTHSLLLWVKDAPKINQDSDADMCRFIDKYITAVVPKGVLESECDANLMKSLQKHTHSDYCHRNKSCHFGFPKPPASRKVISCKPSEEDKADDIMQKIYYKRCRLFYCLLK